MYTAFNQSGSHQQTHYTSDNDPTFLLDEEIDDEDDEDDDEITGYVLIILPRL